MKFSQKEVTPFTLREILVALACQGAFDECSVPYWAEGGTKFAEVWEALQALGRQCDDDDGSIPDGFDDWFDAYCRGHEVCEPSEIGSDEDDDEE